MPARSCTSLAHSRPLFALLALVSTALLAAPGCRESATPRQSAERVRIAQTGPLTIDRIYHSMQGPYERVALDVSDLDWVTALRTEVVDAATGEALGDEFFCHSQLQQRNSTRLLVTATGSEEIRFPPGFAMPVTQILSGLPPAERQLWLLGMVLNNHDPRMHRDVRVRATIRYWTDEDASRIDPPLQTLYKVGLAMSVRHLSEIETAAGRFTGVEASAQCESMPGYDTHWMVPPGPQTTRMRWSGFLPVDATVHYAAVHLHNHGVYFRLTDLTAGRPLWETRVVYEPDRVQIADVPTYSSVRGFRMPADHEYQIEARYENGTDHDVDAMAVIYLYYHPDGDVRLSYPVGPGYPEDHRGG